MDAPELVTKAVIDTISKQAWKSPGEVSAKTKCGADLGLHSLDIVELIMALEDRLGIDLDDDCFDHDLSVEEIVAIVNAEIRKGMADAKI